MLKSLLILICIESVFSQGLRIVQVEPEANRFILKNFGTAIDVSNYDLCSRFTYTSGLSGLQIVLGDLNLSTGEQVTLSGFTLEKSGADFGLYLPSSSGRFNDPAQMVDFVQWGSAGNGRESVANSKGIWKSGGFLPANKVYSYTGNGIANGLENWTGGPVPIIKSTSKTPGFSLYLNGKVLNFISEQKIQSAVLYNSKGKSIHPLNLGFNQALLPGNLSGIYYIRWKMVDGDFRWGSLVF